MHTYQLPSSGLQTYISGNDLYKMLGAFKRKNIFYLSQDKDTSGKKGPKKKEKKKKMSRFSRDGSVLCDTPDRCQGVTSRGPYNTEPDVNWAIKA
jgi:hypothetical protein